MVQTFELAMGLRPTHRDESPPSNQLIPNWLYATFEGDYMPSGRTTRHENGFGRQGLEETGLASAL
jgi:hypothetical protein